MSWQETIGKKLIKNVEVTRAMQHFTPSAYKISFCGITLQLFS